MSILSYRCRGSLSVIGSRSLFTWGHRTIEDIQREKEKREQKKLKRLDLPQKFQSYKPSQMKSQIMLQYDSSIVSSTNSEMYRNRSILADTTKAETALVDYNKNRKNAYLPARILQEAETLKDPTEGNWIERDWLQIFQIVRRPRFSYFFNYNYFVEEARQSDYYSLVKKQLFDEDRLRLLGPDLSAAWFLVSRNCKIKFKNRPEWIECDGRGNINGTIPSEFESGYYLEAVDASKSLLVYEGLQNFRGLYFLKYLDLSYCEMIDEFFIDRLVGEFQDTLEYLDISGTYRLDWNGIEGLWKLRKLKVLILRDMDHVENLKLLCLLLLEVNPDLEIRGVDYMEINLLKGTENEGLLEEYENQISGLLEAGGEEDVRKPSVKIYN